MQMLGKSFADGLEGLDGEAKCPVTGRLGVSFKATVPVVSC